MQIKEIVLKQVKEPTTFQNVAPTFLTDDTMNKRKSQLLNRMKEESFDTLVIYADKEHGSNFEYLTGFIPRFEEGLLVVESSGSCTAILGNENLKLAPFSRTPVELIHSPLFSLPNQPMDNDETLEAIFEKLGFAKKNKIGIVGWKMFTTKASDSSKLFDVPHFIVQALMNTKSAQAEMYNAAYLLIGEDGVRTVNNANEIAHYEYGANLASRCMLNAMNQVEIGKKESELGAALSAEGQYHSVVTIAATGKRFEMANIYPTHKQVQLADPLSLTVGYKGGLSSRTGFVIKEEKQLPENQKDYLDRVAKPYFRAVVSWLEGIKIGMKGKELYQLVEETFPKKEYHWHLNPGHLVSDDEWMSSPVYSDSSQILKSGMIFQLDIIPSVEGYTGVSAEECVALADESLQEAIKMEYPALWERISLRKSYLKNELNIELSQDVIPLSNIVAYMRPFFLAKDLAFQVEK